MTRTASKLITIFSVLCLTASCGIPGLLEDRANADRWDKTTAKKFVNISELRTKKTDGMVYETEGYVVDSSPQCNCPFWEPCKCDPASITISELNNPRKSRDLTEKEIRIATNPERFKQNQIYRFKVRVLDSDLGRDSIDSVDLIAYRFEETETKKTPEPTTTPPLVTETNASRWEKATAKEFLTISELKKKNPRDGVYETEGYIVDSVSKCNCPPDQKCKCDPASITISEVFEIPKSRDLGEKEIRILTDPKGLSGDQKYRFKIEIPESCSDGEKIDEVFLVAYRAPKNSG
ncbi:MAG: hypothetical protein HKN25_10130 [Pyrinomonadaceae bacterium]|nr:hypothetical protein [Pyrinomonadaceae bacterium]